MEKSISEIVQPHFHGKPKFHYVVKYQGRVLYRCTSVMKYQDEVLDAIIDRFRQENGIVSIFRNGERVAVLNRIKRGLKSI